MKLLNYLLLLFLLPSFTFAQGPIATKVQNMQTKSVATEFSLVTTSSSSLKSVGIEENELTKGVLVDLDITAIQNLQKQKPEFLELEFPLPEKGNAKVSLVPNNVLSPDFILRQSSNPKMASDYKAGLYYHGIINNDPSSLVSVTIFENEIVGMINTADNGNFIIGKVKGHTNKHIIYNDLDSKSPMGLDCSTEDDGIQYKDSELTFDATAKDAGDCIRVYIEIDDDIVTDKGGATGATNYITGIMNEVITLYANDGLTMNVSEILAWDTPAPYSGSSSSAMLSSFQANTGSFNGDLSHLVSYQASGGIAAGFSGICNSNVDNSKCFSSIGSSYSTVPTYSFTVMVVTHEMGHLIGSRHTHACVWNGNSTAIDGCAGGTEGSCSLPGSPSNGGTIMSYCHLTTGIDFTQGFGPQPKAVILNTVTNANCLSPCSTDPPTCTDGIQNGNETGVDCGGSDCPACPPAYCNSSSTNTTYEYIQSVNLGSINNSSGNNGGYADYTNMNTTLDAGNSYTANLTPGFASTSYNEFWSIWIDYNGDYDFDDAGELVGQGSGSGAVNISITVPSNASAIATRMRVSMKYNAYSTPCETFTYGEVEDYGIIIQSGTAPTCSDGIQNGNETGVDCGGPDCAACPTCNDGIQNQGETDVDCGGPNCSACPTCSDGIQNGNETGVDCGGPDCVACATCSDGIQNGNETGVDCGGPDCDPCSSGCNDTEVTVSITFDNYPEETSWTITNSNGSVVASGGTYGSEPDGSTFTEVVCLDDGCYDFTINDTYGDGICCTYGNGSYSVSAGTTLASGGSFTSSETTNFCLGSTAPTCSDGVQNGDETGVDCGGSSCPACPPTGGEILGSYFETGWDGWSDGGSDCYRYSGTRSYEGNYSIRIRDNSGTVSAMTSGTHDVSGYSELTINFYFYPNSMENGEDFWVRYYDGSSWNTVASYASGTSFNNGSFYSATVVINSASYNFPTNAQFRFQCDASANADQIYIDQVKITGSAGSMITEGTTVSIEELGTPVEAFEAAENPVVNLNDKLINVYPNPATDLLSVNSEKNIQSIQIVSLAGKTIRTIQVTDQYEALNISDLQPGIYYLLIQADGEMIPQKFIKL